MIFEILRVIRYAVLPQVFRELLTQLQKTAELPFSQPVHDLRGIQNMLASCHSTQTGQCNFHEVDMQWTMNGK